MAIPTGLTGLTLTGDPVEVDTRWTMAYAAALGDVADAYLDTLDPDGVVAHPLFPVCVEWPSIVRARDVFEARGVPRDDTRRGVHATHDLVVHRLIRPGDRLTTTLTVDGVEARRPGAFVTLRLDTVDTDGLPVATTRQATLYLGCPIAGPDRPGPEPDPTDGAASLDDVVADLAVVVSPGAAHVYTECARIWNPIHTDRRTARAAGLPGLVLHGTATLAHAVTAVVEEVAGGDPRQVRRVTARFGAMVLLPSTITVRLGAPEAHGDTVRVRFEVRTAEGAAAVDRGAVVLGPPETTAAGATIAG